ncbi:MAG: hypothetical protein K5989_09130, partial [Lachnospiraceae bacterium]|nr:hypothetical protein [Lachnospiraceae bacterium]
MTGYSEEMKDVPFQSYEEYMGYIFDCVNICLDHYITQMKGVFASEQGGYKNVLYPDIEVAGEVCRAKLMDFAKREKGEDSGEENSQAGEGAAGGDSDALPSDDDDLLSKLAGGFGEDEDTESGENSHEDSDSDSDNEEGDDVWDDGLLLSLMRDFSAESQQEDEEEGSNSGAGPAMEREDLKGEPEIHSRLDFLDERAEATLKAGIRLPFYELCKKLDFESFTRFCFACGILSSTQTDYAGIYQIINENGNLSVPTIESAAKLYYGNRFSITGAYGDMSACLEQLLPILSLDVRGNMPFSTVVSPDKRIIDFLFGRNPEALDEDYNRFFSMLTKSNEDPGPVMANEGVLDAMEISYSEGGRIFYYYGDEGSGRRFFVKKFCQKSGLKAIAVNCKKLFNYDFQFVSRALWAVTRECILINACCCLTELTFREEEKEKFFGYMDMAFSRLTEKDILVFAMSKEHIDFREVTKEQYTELELPTPDTGEREACWQYFAQNYKLWEECDLLEMSTKFLFTPGKIKDALVSARNLSAMKKEEVISRDSLFRGCYNQMSSELTQKATKIKA